MENSILILVPLYIAYIIFLGLIMLLKRLKAIKTKQIKLSYFKDYTGETPNELRIYKNHFDNQFQFPIIFLITCIAIVLTKTAGPLNVFLCYLFFVTRILHSYFHLGSNNLNFRAASYLTGALAVLGIWIDVTIKYFL